MSVEVNDPPGAAFRWKTAWVMSRVVEKPVISTSRKPLARISLMPFATITGAERGITMEAVAFGGVTLTPAAVSVTVSVMVPATVPVDIWSAGRIVVLGFA